MQSIQISGTIGRDAELRSAGQGDVLAFSVAVKQGWGDKASTNWFRCNVWGKRGATLEQHLRKGVRVFLSGELSIGEYQGKPQWDIRVAEIDFVPAGQRDDRRQEPRRQQSRGDDYDSEVPF